MTPPDGKTNKTHVQLESNPLGGGRGKRLLASSTCRVSTLPQ